jgi:hypothetical protein
VGERSLLNRVTVEAGQGGQPPGNSGTATAGLLELADVGLDVATVRSQQPNADPGAPGVEVAEVGQVGGARTVAVAEEEPSSQPLVGLGIEEQSLQSVRLQCAANRVG